MRPDSTYVLTLMSICFAKNSYFLLLKSMRCHIFSCDCYIIWMVMCRHEEDRYHWCYNHKQYASCAVSTTICYFRLITTHRHYLTGAACNRHLIVKPAVVTCLHLLFRFLAYRLVGQVTTNISHVVISIVISFLINNDPSHMKAIGSKEG